MTQQAQISRDKKEIRALQAQFEEGQAFVRESACNYGSTEDIDGERAWSDADLAAGILACATHLACQQCSDAEYVHDAFCSLPMASHTIGSTPLSNYIIIDTRRCTRPAGEPDQLHRRSVSTTHGRVTVLG